VTYRPPTPEDWDKPGPSEGVTGTRWWRKRFRRLARFVLFSRRRRMPEVKFKPPLGLLDIDEPSETFTIESPALGDAYNFRIQVRCSWCVQATASEDEKEEMIAEIRDFIARSRVITRERLEDRIRPIARKYPPYRPAEAEAELNREIVDCLNDGAVRVKVRAWVDISDPVREDLKKVWQQRLTVDADGDLKKVHVGLLTELQAAWQHLLLKGLEDIGAVPEVKTGWLAPYALALAQDPKGAAVYLKEALEKRVSQTDKLLSDLGELVTDERIEEIEFAFQSDSALRALLTYLGVPIPSSNEKTGVFGGNGHD
jgi:hypothetical protein